METAHQLIILAAGEGKRLGSNVPKPLVRVGGIPIIERIITEMAPLFPRPIVVVGSRGTHIQEVLGDRAVYAVQDAPRGTGHAVGAALPLLEGVEAAVVIPGDHPFMSRETLSLLAHAREHQNAALALVAMTVPHFGDEYVALERYGRILRDESGFADRIVEWKDARENERGVRCTNIGQYCFSVPWLMRNIGRLTADNAQQEFYITDLIAIARAEDERVVLHEINDYRQAIGVNTSEDLAFAEKWESKGDSHHLLTKCVV